jgi:transcriptional regulator with XRE-family HTH domain
MGKLSSRGGGRQSGHVVQGVVQVFARRMKEWRKDQGLPLKHVAKELGVSVSIVSEWENGNRFPSVSNLESIAKYLGMPVCCLLYPGKGKCRYSNTVAK